MLLGEGACRCSTQGEGPDLGPSSLAAFHPFLPGGGQWDTEWDREEEQHCRKIHTYNLIRFPPQNLSQLGFIRERSPGVIIRKADPILCRDTFVLAGVRCAPGKAG